MRLFTLAALLAFLTVNTAQANDDCDKCRKLVEANYLVCLKKAKSEADKKECDTNRDNQKKVCQVTKCIKGLF